MFCIINSGNSDSQVDIRYNRTVMFLKISVYLKMAQIYAS